jgi:hypothetical protein
MSPHRRHVRGVLASGLAAMIAAVAIPWLAACNGDSRPVKPKPPAMRVKENLPSGRFQLPTIHTPAPDLWITLPSGYMIKLAGRLPNDEFYIFSKNDPTLKDSTASSPGFLRIYIGVLPQTAMSGRQAYDKKGVLITGRAVVWRLWTDSIPGGGHFYNREITSDDFFVPVSPELANAPLHLHIYVGGTDSARVADLMASAESLALTP